MFSELSKHDVWLCVFAIEWNFATFAEVSKAVESWPKGGSLSLIDHLHQCGAISGEAHKSLDDLIHNRPTTLVLPKSGKTTLRDVRRVNELKAWSTKREKRSLEDTAIAK
jgi:hypothetical protein